MNTFDKTPAKMHATSNSRLCSLLISSFLTTLSGCSTVGEDFQEENAAKVKNGMTREQVITTMGSNPSSVEGHDRGYLLWIYSKVNSISAGANTKKVMFTLDESGHVYGIPQEGFKQ